MLSVIIKNSDEEKVVQMTYDNLWRELKDMADVELRVFDNWIDSVGQIKNDYVCFVEPDCLVNSGYFSSQLGLFKKNPMFRKLAMLSSGTGVNQWGNKFYGYKLGDNYVEGITPVKEMKSSRVYPVQIGFVPGSIIRVAMLKKVLSDLKATHGIEKDLVYFSTQLSIAFWKQGDGNRVHINPNTTYVTTEEYINDIGRFDINPEGLVDKFKRECIGV